ncbi:hypothetical protein RRG08_008329 [Elysia crispata]|uniref:Uncharacterized protein n=1 Tax=Elysia crispata TaxID=231223 RepID=A0AAE1A984_9GAST|nr:hypothetical protein RRG08_008329 [Elysia crispata]
MGKTVIWVEQAGEAAVGQPDHSERVTIDIERWITLLRAVEKELEEWPSHWTSLTRLHPPRLEARDFPGTQSPSTSRARGSVRGEG